MHRLRMLPTPQGSFRLFRFSGITVFLHWSWFVVGYLIFQNRRGLYDSPVWNILEYLSLFAIVLLHEFGHSLACRQIGGQAEQIILWPLGGVAYVAPPQRPGAVLWSIAAGPLVNVVLIPVLFGLGLLNHLLGGPSRHPGASELLHGVTIINLSLLVFNILPIYPLDGGQILRAILWFFIGPVRSLKVAVIIGFIGCAALGAWALLDRSIWLGVIAAFIFSNCLNAWKHAQAMAAHERGDFPRV